jgi:hypothetical protein
MFVGFIVLIKRSAKNEHKVIFLLTKTLNRAIMEAEESEVKGGEITKHISDLVPEEEEVHKAERRVNIRIQKLSPQRGTKLTNNYVTGLECISIVFGFLDRGYKKF